MDKVRVVAEIGMDKSSIIEIGENSLGLKRQIISTTKVKVRCGNCNQKEWWTNYNNHKNRKHETVLCQSCKNRLGISGMKGKKHSISAINKFSDGRRAGNNNPSKRVDVKEKISKALKDREVPWLAGKKRPEHAKLMSEFMTKVWNINNKFRNDYRSKLIKSLPNNHSKLHDRVKKWLIENDVTGFKSEKTIKKTNFIVDELNESRKIVIEIYGDFWHANPNIYKKNETIPHPNKSRLSNEIWSYDIMREKIIKDMGYKIFIIWELDFNSNKKELIAEIREWMEIKIKQL